MTFYATNTLIKDGEVTRTMDLRMSYLQRLKNGRIKLIAEVEARHKDTLWVEARFYLPDGTLAVKASSQVLVLPIA